MWYFYVLIIIMHNKKGYRRVFLNIGHWSAQPRCHMCDRDEKPARPNTPIY